MATEILLPLHSDNRGKLTVIEKILPFDIKRVYYIYDCCDQPRGGHRHKRTVQALICLNGSCVVEWNNGIQKDTTILDSPTKLLLLQPEDFHVMRSFTKDCILLVLASDYFDIDDYIYEDYK